MRVVLAFSSTSVGGTSRSAVNFAALWAQAGAEVFAYSPRPPHPSRAAEMTSHGIRLIGPEDLNHVENTDLVHLHHFAPSPLTTAWVKPVFDRIVSPSTALLTHNIFGQKLSIGSTHAMTIVGLLGSWLAHQYMLQSLGGQRHAIRVVPNPQDFRYFRPPSDAERQDARRERGLQASSRVLLRVGSPIEEKWAASSYEKLAQKVIEQPNCFLRLVGCPKSLVAQVPTHERIVKIDSLDDDSELRNEYWAADIFAHWAIRGESFGNVILEALGTGLPVVYKSREFRDNTPYEFSSIPNFLYATSRKEWFKNCFLPLPRLVDNSVLSSSFYSNDTVRTVLTRCVEEVDQEVEAQRGRAAFDFLCQELMPPKPLSKRHKARIFLRHNPLLAHIKERRLAIRQLQEGVDK